MARDRRWKQMKTWEHDGLWNRAVHGKDEREWAWETGSPLRNESAFPAAINLSARADYPSQNTGVWHVQGMEDYIFGELRREGGGKKRRNTCSGKLKMFTSCTQTFTQTSRSALLRVKQFPSKTQGGKEGKWHWQMTAVKRLGHKCEPVSINCQIRVWSMRRGRQSFDYLDWRSESMWITPLSQDLWQELK